MTELLSVVVLLGSGTTMGVFFAVAVSVAPALATMAPGSYVEAHRLLGKGYHPTMPIVTNTTMVTGIVLALLTDGRTTRALLLAGAVLVLGVQGVSHLGNVPINRSLRDIEEGRPWSDPRPRWRMFHLIRFGLAVAALLANSLAITLVA